MKEIIIHENALASIKLSYDEKEKTSFQLKNDYFDTKKKAKEALFFNMQGLKELKKALDEIIPKSKNNPLVISKESIKMIADENGIISLGQLANYLQFDDVQEMVNLLPDNIKVLAIGDDMSKAVIKASELNKSSSMTELKNLKS